jgi:UDP-glucose 4-epimerase
MVLPNFVRQALDNAPIPIYGSGQQSRCFCHVRDTVESLLRLTANERAIGEVVNIGTDQEISMEGLAHLVKQRTKSTSTLEFIPYEKAYEPGFEDMQRRVPALEKLQSLAGGFRPTTPLSKIIDDVADYIRSKSAADVAVVTHQPAAAPSLS